VSSTVDLSSYKVNKLGQYRDLERVSILAGDLCGSSLLNRIFEAYLEKKLGIQLEQWGEARQRWFKSVVKNDFEKRIKPQFTGEEGADYNYRIDAFGFPDNTNQGIKKESLQIPAREIRTEVFDKVISKIKALVLEQVIATGNVKEVLLAGGFGQNEYLKIQLQTAVGNTVIVRKIKDRSVLQKAKKRGQQ
jgi:hydrogenase maturation factor HypF (carbamoyltransferase family)